MPTIRTGSVAFLAWALSTGVVAAQGPAPDPAAQPPGGTAGQNATQGQAT